MGKQRGHYFDLTICQAWDREVNNYLRMLERLYRLTTVRGEKWTRSMARYYIRSIDDLLEHAPEKRKGMVPQLRRTLNGFRERYFPKVTRVA